MSSEITRFDQLALSAPLLKVLEEIGYETPSAIQAVSIPPIIEGHDMIGQAQTGTGKTAAFALPLIDKLELHIQHPQVMVLTPTRELAIQVAEAFQTYARHMKGFHVLPIYGGQSMQHQLRYLKRGAHVVVGTPGRIMDHLRRKSLVLDALKSLVLDEADEMLRMGFIEDVEWILEHTPKERQIALFSATMPPAIRKVARKHLRDPKEIKIETSTSTVKAIKQFFWKVSGMHKLDALTRMLEVEEFDAAIIFVRTKTATLELAEKLEARGYSCAALNGDITQDMRERTVNQLKNKQLDIIVATDVAARGLDVQRITHVINYDIPNDVESYIHRIGRTGRAGREGKAILFVAPREMRLLTSIERSTRQPLEHMQLPSVATITDRRIAQFKQQIVETLETEKLDFFYDVIDQLVGEEGLELQQVATALAFLAQRERPLQLKEEKVHEEKGRKGKSRDDRPGRGDRNARDNDDRPKRRDRKEYDDSDKVRYRIEVGRIHGISPGNIVGAIANEAGIDSQLIGHIKLYDDFSTVDLPDGMPKDILMHLKNVRVMQHRLDISLDNGKQDSRKEKKPFGKKDGFKKDSARKDKPKGGPRKESDKKSGKFSGKKPADKRKKPGKDHKK